MQNLMRKYIPQIKISYQNNIHPDQRIQIDSSQTAYEVLMAGWNRKRIELVEEAKIILLDPKKRCLGVSSLSVGGMSETTVDTRIVMATALLAKASGIILAHNHPSCVLRPSFGDRAVTADIFKAGKIHNIQLVDHLIVSPYSYHSFGDMGEMPSLA